MGGERGLGSTVEAGGSQPLLFYSQGQRRVLPRPLHDIATTPAAARPASPPLSPFFDFDQEPPVEPEPQLSPFFDDKPLAEPLRQEPEMDNSALRGLGSR